MTDIQLEMLFDVLDILIACCGQIVELMTVQLCFFAIMTGILFFIGHRTGGLFVLVFEAGLVGSPRTREAGEPYHRGTPVLWEVAVSGDVGGDGVVQSRYLA